MARGRVGSTVAKNGCVAPDAQQDAGVQHPAASTKDTERTAMYEKLAADAIELLRKCCSRCQGGECQCSGRLEDGG